MVTPRSLIPRLPSSFRFRVPLAVLLGSIGLTALAVVDAQRAVHSQRAVTERALREYATFAAWSYGQHLNEAFTTLAREAIGAVNHGDNMHTSPRVPPARDLAHYLPWDPTCMCHRARSGPNPETFFAFRIGSDSLDVGINSRPAQAEGWEVDRPLPAPLTPGLIGPYTPEERRWVVDSLTRRIRASRQPDHGYSLVVGDVDGKPRIVTYTLMPTSWGDTMVYGARYSVTDFAHILGGVLDGNGARRRGPAGTGGPGLAGRVHGCTRGCRRTICGGSIYPQLALFEVGNCRFDIACRRRGASHSHEGPVPLAS